MRREFVTFDRLHFTLLLLRYPVDDIIFECQLILPILKMTLFQIETYIQTYLCALPKMLLSIYCILITILLYRNYRLLNTLSKHITYIFRIVDVVRQLQFIEAD